MTFRFVHTADIHLDSPLRSLALRDPEIAEMIGNATRQAFERTVDLCLEERVDALMIAGDLYDGDLRSMKTAVFFGAQMRRLTEAGIRVFIICARQMVGKRRAPGRGAGIRVGIVHRRLGVRGFRAGDIGVEILEPEGQLTGIEALGPASELPSLKLSDDALETVDLVIAGLDDGRHVAHQAMQKADIGRQVLEIETHERF